ncbi:MAG: hypothetical protein NVS9B4_01180 [Candidatus Acidiferrum sp.]
MVKLFSIWLIAATLIAQQIWPPPLPTSAAPPYGPIVFSASAVAQNILATQHHFTTQLIRTVCFDGATNAETSMPATVNPSTFTVTISPGSPFTGNCWLVGSGPPLVQTGATAPYGPINFSSASAQTILATSHNFTSRAIKSICYDTATAAETYIPTVVNPGTFAVTLTPAESFTGSCYLIGVGSAVVSQVNGWIDNGTTVSTPRIVGIGSLAFAGLGAPANGTLVYCTDCTQANPTAAGGAGALVRRINGAWVGADAAGGGGSTLFSALTGSTNTTAAMVIGTGASLAATGSGTIAATSATNATSATSFSGALAGDVTGTQGATTVAKVNGTTIPTNAAADQVPLTTASQAAAWKAVPACLDSAGNHLNYDTVAHTFSCGTSSSAGGGTTFSPPYMISGGVKYGPVFGAFTSVIDANFSWLNQGSATLSYYNGAAFITAPALAGSNVKARIMTVPAAPYSVVLAIVPQMSNVATNNCGLLLYEAASTKLVTFNIGQNNGLAVNHYTSPTVYATTSFNLVLATQAAPVLFIKFRNDGTNIAYSVSTNNGNDFITIGSEAFATGFTTAPDRMGFYCEASNATNAAAMLVLGWNQGT